MIRRLYLFDDAVAREWEPFSLTRPAGELLFGALLLRERVERALGLSTVGYVATPGLEGFEDDGAPPALDRSDLPEAEDRILLTSRYLPPIGEGGGAAPTVRLPGDLPPRGIRLGSAGAPVGWLLPAGAPNPPVSALVNPETWTTEGEPGAAPADVELPGELLQTPWQLMDRNTGQLAADLIRLHPGGLGPGCRPLPPIPGVHRIGSHPVSAGDGVVVDPGAVLDTRNGPIHLAAGVHLRAFTDLRGPSSIGRDSVLMGGVFEAVACGPMCRLRGEVEASIILGYTNKAHDGYLGHSILGRWVNLGAFTTNSDLKNNYGTIRVRRGPGEVDTGLLKVGVFLGDHVKTGIGTLLNAGTLVGAGTNLFGGTLPGKHVAPFRWGTADELVTYRLDPFLSTAERAMGRRNVPLTPGHRRFLSRAWESAQEGREDG